MTTSRVALLIGFLSASACWRGGGVDSEDPPLSFDPDGDDHGDSESATLTDIDTTTETEIDTDPACEDDWVLENPPIGAGDLSGLWVFASDDLWIAGDGKLMHWDGESWFSFEVDGCHPKDLWGASDGTVLAAGSSPCLLRWDGSTWSELSVPDGLEASVDGVDMWGTAPDAAWAALASGSVLEWDGSAWTVEATIPAATLSGIWSGTAGEAWVVGHTGGSDDPVGSAWLVADGESSLELELPGVRLLSVWGVPGGDLFVVGHTEAADGEETPIVCRRAGQEWSEVVLPEGGLAVAVDVWGRSLDDVFVVGERGGSIFSDGPAIVHFDGFEWHEELALDGMHPFLEVRGAEGVTVATGRLGLAYELAAGDWRSINGFHVPGPYSPLPGVTSFFGTDTGEVFAAAGAAFRREGERWIPMDSPPGLRVDVGAAVSADDLWVGGPGVSFAHWDGSAWTETNLESGEWIFDATVDESGLVSAVTMRPGILSIPTPESEHTVVVQLDGSGWTALPAPGFSPIAVAATGPGTILAVGYEGGSGMIASWDGASWSLEHTVDDTAVIQVWANSPDEAYAVTSDEDLLVKDGVSWTSPGVIPSVYDQVSSIWAATPDEIWALEEHDFYSSSGRAHRFRNGGWECWPLQFRARAMWGVEEGLVWVVGADAYSVPKIQRFENEEWTDVPVPTGASAPRAVWGASACEVWIATDSGQIFMWDGESWSAQAEFPYDVPALLDGSSAGPLGISRAGTVVAHESGGWSVVDQALRCNTVCGMLALSSDDVWAACNMGDMLHYDGAAWSLGGRVTADDDEGNLDCYYTAMSNRIWAVAPDDIWAVVAGDRLARYDGSQWTLVDALQADVYGVTGLGPDDVHAVGPGGFWRFDGASWEKTQDAPYADSIVAAAASEDRLYALGTAFGLFAWNGAEWTSVQVTDASLAFPTSPSQALWSTQDDRVFVGGFTGEIFSANCQ